MPSRARTSLQIAGLLGVLLIVTWFTAFHVPLFEHADKSIYTGFGDLKNRPHVRGLASFIANLCDPKPYVYLCAIPIAVALVRRRLWVALAIVAIVLGANVTTQLLKPLLEHSRGPVPGLPVPSANAWPSGHATAAMSLALSCVLAASRRWRPLTVALGAAFAVAVSYSFLTLGWHYPSDVFGGFLVAGIWTLLAVAAVLTATERRRVQAGSEFVHRLSIREALGPPSAALLGAIALSAVVVILRPQGVANYARAHEAFVVGASAIAALGLALATGVMLTLRR